jgi:Family of unknown function (DUF6880)
MSNSMNKKIVDQLSNLSKQELLDFITSLYGQNKALDSRIETLALKSDPKSLHKALKKRVQSLNRSKRFIDYGESFEFSKQLDLLLSDIQSLLLPLSASLAFDLTDRFLLTANTTFERVDDSAGAVGDSYRQAVELWLLTALQWQNSKGAEKKCTENWQERIVTLFQNNGYGVFDALLPNSGQLLQEEELRQLAWRFESDARGALSEVLDSDAYNYAASHACIGLQSVAQALQDIELYERATLIQSPELNELQKISLARYSLKLAQGESALKWLQDFATQRFEKERLELLDECYRLLQDDKNLLEVRRQSYQHAPNFDSLCALAAVLPEKEKSALMLQAIEDAKALHDVVAAANMLLELEAAEQAEQLLLSRSAELKDKFYGDLTQLANALEPFNRPLVESLCYRALLEDILTRGYSKAYRYAARYYQKIHVLDDDISDYHGHSNCAKYLAGLREQHGRKRSFWGLVGG